MKTRILKYKYYGVTLITVLLLGFTFKSGGGDYFFQLSKNLDIFAKILREVTGSYVDDVEVNQLTKEGIDEMLKSLDPYTVFISASEVENYRLQNTEASGGIGEELDKFEGKIIITEIYQDKPAHKAGLEPGDEIVKIDHETIEDKGFEIEDARNLLRGQAGAKVNVTVRRDGQLKEFAVTREEIKNNNVHFYGFVEDGYGYIALTNFLGNAAGDVKDAFEKLKTENPNMKGVILDLRGNPGGLLTEAVAICNLFVDKGQKITETRGKMEGSYKRYDTQLPAFDREIPLTVLVNKNSASASEIVSGAMQDLDRGVIVGRKSYGKGLVQVVRPLSYNHQLKITISRYYTPSGRCVQSIDYSKRAKDGSPIKTPDSLQRKFKTLSGRPVLDAGGVEPDVKVDEPKLHKVTNDLMAQRLIHGFAAQYRAKHDSIPSPKKFVVSDALFNEFIAYVKSKNFKYEPRPTKSLENLRKSLEKEAYYAQTEGQFNELKSVIDKLKENDLFAHKDEIRRTLGEEIIGRYYFKKGKIEASFTEDPDVREAVAVLKDPARYHKILGSKN